MSKEPIWMELDLRTEGVRALEMTVEQVERVLEDPYRWKWAVIAAHNALQAFMAEAVAGTAQLGQMTERYIRKWHEAYERGDRPKSEPRLADFMDLFERVQSDRYMKRFGHSRRVEATDEQAESVRDLNYWRGEFVHYKRGSHSIEVRGLPEILRDCLEIARFLAFDSGQVFHSGGPLPDRVDKSLTKAASVLDEIEASYGS